MVMEEVNIVIEDFGNEIEKQEELTQPISTPKKSRFTEESSILKELSVSKRKPINLKQPYFRPRFNFKPKKKKGIFRTMVFKTYLQLSILIFIQNLTDFGETETKLLATLTSIWKSLSSIDQHTVIFSWHPKVEDSLRPLKTSDSMSNPLINSH